MSETSAADMSREQQPEPKKPPPDIKPTSAKLWGRLAALLSWILDTEGYYLPAAAGFMRTSTAGLYLEENNNEVAVGICAIVGIWATAYLSHANSWAAFPCGLTTFILGLAAIVILVAVSG